MTRTRIVILNWNGAAHLRRFLPSVVASTQGLEGRVGIGHVEVVVADNGSTDDSLSLLAHEFPTTHVVQLDRNYGYAGGYNRALQQLEADYFILLNSDVETPTGWLEPLVETLERDAQVAAVQPKILSLADPHRFDYAGAAGGMLSYLGYPWCRGRIGNHTEKDKGQYDDARDIFWASGAAFCCRADVFRELGGFDEAFFAHQEEIDLCWRMRLNGYRVRVEPRSHVYHLGGGTLATNSPRKVFLNHRNNLWMIFRNAPWHQRITVALTRPWLDGMAAFVYLLQGRPRNTAAVFRAWKAVLQKRTA